MLSILKGTQDVNLGFQGGNSYSYIMLHRLQIPLNSVGRRSVAKQCRCIPCGKLQRSAYLHTLGECDASQSAVLDAAWGDMGLRDRSVKLMCCSPNASRRLVKKMEMQVNKLNSPDLPEILAPSQNAG